MVVRMPETRYLIGGSWYLSIAESALSIPLPFSSQNPILRIMSASSSFLDWYSSINLSVLIKGCPGDEISTLSE